MVGWDARLMFDLYLYDYLRKNNMHQTAAIFFREANLAFDPTVPTAIDIPDGFLHEWWLFFYDMYRSRQARVRGFVEDPATMVEQMMEAMQQLDPSPSRQYMMNEQTFSRLLAGTDPWFNTGVNALDSMRLSLLGAEQIPLGISSSLHQQDPFTYTSVLNLPGNVADITGQEVGCSVFTAPRKAKIASEENGRRSISKSNSIDGNGSLLEDADATSEASLVKCKSSDDKVKSSSSHDNGVKDDGGASSSKLPGHATTAGDLIVHQVVESKKEG